MVILLLLFVVVIGLVGPRVIGNLIKGPFINAQQQPQNLLARRKPIYEFEQIVLNYLAQEGEKYTDAQKKFLTLSGIWDPAKPLPLYLQSPICSRIEWECEVASTKGELADLAPIKLIRKLSPEETEAFLDYCQLQRGRPPRWS